jgi:hypothetical protein
MSASVAKKELTPTETSRVIGSDGIRATPTGLKIDVRLPWYRSLPLSTVEVGEVRIDGTLIDHGHILFELENERFTLGDLANQIGTVWYVLDSGYLIVEGGPWKAGCELEIEVTLILYPPYIPGLKRMTVQSKKLKLGPIAPDQGKNP